jgi:formylglycine-generating enzyme required for sulfatase activity
MNKFETPEDTESRADDFATRVLRGGSWDSVAGGARCAFRSRLHPSLRSSGVGFRVLCSSPIVEH